MEEERDFVARVERMEEKARELACEEDDEATLSSLETVVEEVEKVGREMEEGMREGGAGEEREHR
ncbi:MAG: hypothetical protein H5T73_08020 [Actinobacteria bacterium]|nr:hypothetical protein [Actinomycetota bacterium]